MSDKLTLENFKKAFTITDAGRWNFLGVPAVKGGQSMPPPLVGIGLTDLPNIGGAIGPAGPPGSGIAVPIPHLTCILVPRKNKYVSLKN